MLLSQNAQSYPLAAVLLFPVAPRTIVKIADLLPPWHRRRGANAVFERHKTQWHRHARGGSAVVPSLIAVARRKTVNTADLRGGTAETLNMFKTSAGPPRVGPISVRSPQHRRYRAAPPWLPWRRTRTAVAPTPPPCLRNTTAVQSRESRLAPRTAIPWRFYCGYGGATTVLPPHWPRSAAANNAVMPPMIAVAPLWFRRNARKNTLVTGSRKPWKTTGGVTTVMAV